MIARPSSVGDNRKNTEHHGRIYERIQVECYSGYKASERPLAFTYQERRREVEELIDRWYEGGVDSGRPATDYFKLKTTDGEIFILRYLSLFDAWSINKAPHRIAERLGSRSALR